MPTAQIIHMTTKATAPTILTSLTPLSMIFTPWDFNRSFRESQNPIVFILAATAFAKANMIPTDAPNSGPSDLDIM